MNVYLEAATILESKQTSSLKSLIYHSKKYKSPPARLYALIVETLKYQEILNEVIERSGLLEVERKVSPALALLLTHDLLLAKSGIGASKGLLRDAVERNKTRLSAEFARARIRRGHANTKQLVDAIERNAHAKEARQTDRAKNDSRSITQLEEGMAGQNELDLPSPRWIRVNTLLSTLSETLHSTTFAEFKPVPSITELFVTPLAKSYYTNPTLFPDIFAIHPSHSITKSAPYLSGRVILQSASSCMPAIMLSPPRGANVIDACAAPGNKTTHLAALMGGQGRIIAVERDKKRADVLEMMINKANAHNVVECLKGVDFTTITGEKGNEFADIEYVLLDPSCSGSGILGRVDWDLSSLSLPSAERYKTSSTSKLSRKRKRISRAVPDEQGIASRKRISLSHAASPGAEEVAEESMPIELHGDDETKRLHNLSSFQLKILLHAFAFPSAKRITYSTCSLHATENEHVVVAALNSAIAKSRGWRIESRGDNALRCWNKRGLLKEVKGLGVAHEDELERVAEGCVRVGRGDGLGGGFFVACFVRNYGLDI